MFAMYYRMRAEMGLSHKFSVGRIVDVEERAAQWIQIDHARHDGIGGFATLMESEGYGAPTLPAIRITSRPDGEKARLVVNAALGRLEERSVQWKHKLWRSASSIKKQIAWCVADVDQSKAVYERAASLGVSSNSYLLYTLNKILAKKLIEEESKYFWCVPVNMRGAVKLPSPTQNHFSFVTICAGGNSSAADIHKEIKGQLAAEEHWAHWFIYDYLGRNPEQMREIARDGEVHQILGTFSNLGSWTVDGLPDSISWVFVPTMAIGRPIATGAMDVNGRIGLAMHMHETIGLEQSEIQALCQEWLQTSIS